MSQAIQTKTKPASGRPWQAGPVVAWLNGEAWNIPSPISLTARLAERLVADGFPLSRIRVTIRTLHPQVIGCSYTWLRKTGETVEHMPPHCITQTSEFLDSPYAALFEGAGAIRRRLDIPGVKLDFPILEELHGEGVTDYVAMPVVFSDGQINAVTFATDVPGGFSTEELAGLYELLPAMAHLFELHAARRTARDLLETYIGRHTGQRVLEGKVKRGDGEDIHAVIWFCDLRDSTPLADSMPREAFLTILNDFFDCMAGAVLDHGGEVLRFIGDAALAIFPTGETSPMVRQGCCSTHRACEDALAAAMDAQARMADLNRRRAGDGDPPLGYGIGLHMGDLTYGNIGVPERLEFTVIGAAVNEAARLEGLCKTLKAPVLISEEFHRCFPGDLKSLGLHSLRGIDGEREIFTLAD